MTALGSELSIRSSMAGEAGGQEWVITATVGLTGAVLTLSILVLMKLVSD